MLLSSPYAKAGLLDSSSSCRVGAAYNIAEPTKSVRGGAQVTRLEHDFQRAVNVCADGLVCLAAGNEPARISMLQNSLGAHMQQSAARGGSLWSASKDASAFERMKDNLASAWRNSKRNRDYPSARQLLSVLIVGRGRGLTAPLQLRAREKAKSTTTTASIS